MPIGGWPEANWQSEIDNRQSPIMRPSRYRVVVPTSFPNCISTI